MIVRPYSRADVCQPFSFVFILQRNYYHRILPFFARAQIKKMKVFMAAAEWTG
jgi:hypothetical protein